MLKRICLLALVIAAGWIAWRWLRQREDEFNSVTPQLAPLEPPTSSAPTRPEVTSWTAPPEPAVITPTVVPPVGQGTDTPESVEETWRGAGAAAGAAAAPEEGRAGEDEEPGTGAATPAAPEEARAAESGEAVAPAAAAAWSAAPPPAIDIPETSSTGELGLTTPEAIEKAWHGVEAPSDEGAAPEEERAAEVAEPGAPGAAALATPALETPEPSNVTFEAVSRPSTVEAATGLPEAPAAPVEPSPATPVAEEESAPGAQVSADVPTTEDRTPAAEEAGSSDLDDLIGYCVRCKTKRPIVGAHQEMTESGRRAARGTCPVCGANMFTFLATE